MFRSGGWVRAGQRDTTLKMHYNKCRSGSKESQDIWDGAFRHELFHAFGITHTHRRKDRKKYISINYENIDTKNKYQFDVCSTCTIPDKENNPYECDSIMHYNARDGSNNGKDTIVSINPDKCPPEALQQPRIEPTPNDYKIFRDVLQCDKQYW